MLSLSLSEARMSACRWRRPSTTVGGQSGAVLGSLGRKVLPETNPGSGILPLLVERVRLFAVRGRRDGKTLGAILHGPLLDLSNERRADPCPACLFQHHQRGKPSDRLVVVNGW